MRRYARNRQGLESSCKIIEFPFVLQAVDEVVVDNDEQGAGPGDVIEEPEFQPEINQVDDDQIGEPPQPKPNILKFHGRLKFTKNKLQHANYIASKAIMLQ